MDRDYNNDNRPCCPGALARACIPMQVMKEVFSPRRSFKEWHLISRIGKS